MSLSAANSRVRQARMQLESSRLDDVEPALEAAEGFLKALTDAEKAPVLAEIAALRAELSTLLRPADERQLSAAKGKIRQAKSQLEQKQAAADVEVTLGSAEQFLAAIDDKFAAHKAPVLAEIAAIRAALQPAAAVAAPAPAPKPIAPERASGARAPVEPPSAAAVEQPRAAVMEPPRASPPAPPPNAAVLPPAAPSGAGAGKITADDAESALRAAEREVANERSFDAARFAPKRAAAEVAVAALGQLQPDSAALAALRQRLDEVGNKSDAIAIDALKLVIGGLQRAAEREVTNLESAREQKKPKDLDPNVTADKQAEYAKKIRAAVDAAREPLSSARGRAAIAEADAWLAATEQKIAELRVVAEAFALFRATADVQDLGEISFAAAIDSVEWNFSKDPERVVLAWDAVKKLIGPFGDERFASIREIKEALARYQAVAQRVATELRPLLARLRVAPLIRTASSSLELLQRDTDRLAEDGVLQWRQALRTALVPLQRDFSDDPDAQDFLSKCARAFARSEEELGDKLVLREIQAAEVFVKPLVERVERGLALGSVSRVRDHAPRLQARLSAIAPFLSQQRARLLEERARAALGRIEAVLGAEVAREVAEAEAVPRFPIDIAADTKTQAVLGKLNRAFESYGEEYFKSQQRFEEDVDVVQGLASHAAAGQVESAASTMIRAARQAEEIADELRKLDRAHPAIQAVEAAVPRLVKRAQEWKARLARTADYAAAIGRARASFEDAEGARRNATRGHPEDAIRSWPEVLGNLGSVDEAVAQAAAILPEDHDESDGLAGKSAALHKEAREKLAAVCLAEATRRSIQNDTQGAELYSKALKKALPDAPENAQIAAAMAGTADARQKAQAGIQAGGALIEKRAEDAAQAARPAFDAWAEGKHPITALGGTIVQNLEQYTGKWVRCHARHLGRFLYDQPDELNGDIYQFDYDPDVRDHLLAGMKRLDDLYAEMATKVAASHGVSGIATATQHYPSDAHYLCEIVGVASYTPKREVRDGSGRLLGSIEGNPYPVPRVVIRGVATSFFVIVPGQPPSLDAMNAEGLVG